MNMIDTIHNADCRDLMAQMDDNSVDTIITDPPYFKVKREDWDNQWADAEKFLEWLDGIFAEFHRILKPNGSLYVFASPKMSARVELLVGGRFNVLNHIVWMKPYSEYIRPYCGWEKQRAFTPLSERIVFAEHYGADNIAKGEAGYGAKCDELRGFVFEPLRAYLISEMKRAGINREQVRKYFASKLGTRGKMSGHYFDIAQWSLPTEKHYQWLRECLANLNHGGEYLKREYEDLRREYEDLRQEFESLRRPFNVTADVPYTDVWTFPTVQAYKGKHPCEKPLAMIEHMVLASSREGAIVFDPFIGRGTTALACLKTGRHYIGCEKDRHNWEQAVRRVENSQMQMELV